MHELLDRAERLPQAERRPVLVVHHRHPVGDAIVRLCVHADQAAPEVEHSNTSLQLGLDAEALARGPGAHDRVLLFRRIRMCD